MSATRQRRSYFNVPASEQPLRVRERPRAQPAPEHPRDNPLEQLLIGPLFDPAVDPELDDHIGLADQDPAEAKDATWECQHGRLPHDRTPACGCWPQETMQPVHTPAPDPVAAALAALRAAPKPEAPYYRFLRELRTAPLAWPELVYPEPPALIPAWVMADARDMAAGGMTLRKVASAILPVTDCADLPSCEQLLKLSLARPKDVGDGTAR